MDNRTEQIRNLLSQHRQQKESGALTDEELVQNNPELMPELLQELKKLKLIEQAREAARHEDISTDGGPRDQLTTETFSEHTSDPPLDAQVPDYDLLRRIGKGGFGEVWLGHHRLHGEYVAVKIIPKERLVELEGVRSYKHQAKQHSNLVPIEHVGETDTCYYYVMPLADDVKGPTALRSPEYYEPKTLQWCLDNLPPMSPNEVRDLALQLLDALTDLHEVGLMHADVKPANVMQLQGTWKLGDLGLMTRNEQLTMGRGTVAFWPPEGTTGPTADLYALGKTLYLALTNTSLKSFDDFVEGSLAVSGDPGTINHLRTLIQQACHDAPDQRIQTAREFRDLLTQSTPTPATSKEGKTSKPLPWKQILSVASSLLLIGLLAYGIKQLQQREAAPVIAGSTVLNKQLLKNLQVDHLPRLDDPSSETIGNLGISSFWVKPTEQLAVRVTFKQPTRFFVILLKSPGDMQLVHPPSDQAGSLVPTASQGLEMPLHIDEPPADSETPYCLGVMLVTLKEPLTFDQWASQLKENVSYNWPPVRSKQCWFYQDGKLFEARSRGNEVPGKNKPEPPADLVNFCQAVQENKATEQVQIVTAPVLPTHVGSRD